MKLRHFLIGASALACVAPAAAQDGSRIIIRRPLSSPAVATPGAVPTPVGTPTAACGVANGSTVVSSPSTGSLCLSGTASAVSTSVNSYSWSCTNEGSTVGCAATRLAPANGSCGAAQGVSTYSSPTGLCASGAATSVAANPSSYDWSCVGYAGGSTTSCSAPRAYAVTGVCGSANGGATSSPPSSGLCNAGTATGVTTNPSASTSGVNAYSWQCTGSGPGGGTASCASNRMLAGTCGSANGTNRSTAPSGAEQCAYGGPTGVTTTTTAYSWQCTGPYGGPTTSCSAGRIANGVCGSDDGSTTASAPTLSNCSVGTSVGMSTTAAAHTWQCSGVNGGSATSCSAFRPGACGSANGAGATAPPGSNLCSIGSSSAVATNASSYDWSCSNGSVSASCSAPRLYPVNGTCGSSNAGTFGAAPSGSGACSSGTLSSASTQPDAYWWACNGVNGGSTSSCYAYRSPACGPAAGVASGGFPASGYCSIGNSGNGVVNATTHDWTCQNGSSTISCQAPRIVNAACGSGQGVAINAAPWAAGNHAYLCSTPGGSYNGTNNGTTWGWNCAGVNGGSNATCSAPYLQNGSCGSAQGAATRAAPWSNGSQLCSSNQPANNGTVDSWNWGWTCPGQNGGSNTNCSAPRIVDAACGSGQGVAIEAAPWAAGNHAYLCSTAGGSYNGTNDGWNWGWNCAGTNGGAAASCSAPVRANGACGPSQGVTTGPAPWDVNPGNLCSRGGSFNGTADSLNWGWSCSGQNGGANTVCSAPRAPACGSSAGASTVDFPSGELCSIGGAHSGTATASTYGWQCRNGGVDVSCQSNRIYVTNGSCGPANGSADYGAPTSGLCNSGSASGVVDTGPNYQWNCFGSNGGSTQGCYSNKKTNGACGSTNGSTGYPTEPMCSSPGGRTGVVDSGSTYQWTCYGQYGGPDAGCYTNKAPATHVCQGRVTRSYCKTVTNTGADHSSDVEPSSGQYCKWYHGFTTNTVSHGPSIHYVPGQTTITTDPSLGTNIWAEVCTVQ